MSEISIVCVIEAGRLESQTIAMATTLRRFGGDLASSTIVAVQGRHGLPLSNQVHRRLDELEVKHVLCHRLNPAPWFNFSNKIAAVTFAEETFNTNYCLWLDSDVLFLNQPKFCQEVPDTDFAGRFEHTAPALHQGDSRFVPYWKEISEACGLDYGGLEFHNFDFPSSRIRPYFNSGLFLWRRGSGFAETYRECFIEVLKSNIAPKNVGPWYADQVAITLALQKRNLSWRMVELEDHFMLFQDRLQDEEFLAALKKARVLHYSKARNAEFVERFDELLGKNFPQVMPLLMEANSISERPAGSLKSNLRALYRAGRQKLYSRYCQKI